MSEDKPTPTEHEYPERPFAEFLEEEPPGSLVFCPDLIKNVPNSATYVLAAPDLQLHCTHEKCNGLRFFEATVKFGRVGNTFAHGFLVYHCRNCGVTSKTFALMGAQKRSDEPVLATQATQGYIYKIGEMPPFGPPVPARAITLVGPDRELFLKGRNAENQGLGIGAFAYYRRVVENQKDRILAEITRVAQKTRAPNDIVEKLQDARKETQFKKAIDIVKDGIPPVLLIDGHNPLVLLHSALSSGLHAESDEACLEAAADIRVVLYELADRIGQSLKDQNELNRAVSRLLKGTSP